MTDPTQPDRDRILEACYTSLENAGVGALWLNSEGVVINLNEAARTMLDYGRGDLPSQSFTAINADITSAGWAKLWIAVREQGSASSQARYRSRSGRELFVVQSLSSTRIGGFECITVFFTDITLQKETERQLQESRRDLETRNESLKAINRIINNLQKTLNLQEVIVESVSSMTEYVRYPSVVIFRLDHEKNELVLLRAHGFRQETLRVGSVLPVEGSLTGLSITKGTVEVSYDIVSDERIYPIVREELVREGLVCAISVPVMAGEKIIGALNLICEQREPLSALEKETLLSIGKAIGGALLNAEHVKRIQDEIEERTRAEKELRESREKWRSLVENFHEVVFVCELDGRGLYANPSFKEQTGYSADDLRPPLNRLPFVHQDDVATVAAFVDRFLAGSEQYSGTLDSRALDRWGQLRWYSLTITKVTYEGHPALQFVGYDMTSRKQAETALEQALAEVRTLKNRLQEENIYLKEEIRYEHNFDEIIGASSSLRHVMEQVEQVASTDATVLIHGESGSGKELISRAIHERSRRRDRSMIKVNCSAIPRDLFESEFFGHVRGAFTGALKDRVGRFQLADGGTLFLDEIGEIPLELQGKLLRVLQERQFEPVGDDVTRTVDVRIISSTNRSLEEEVARKNFRQDLYFRLNVFPIEVPPLRARTEDIPALTRHFVKKISRRIGIPEVPLNEEHFRRLQAYSWPGNIRELENVIERTLITSRSGVINIALPGASGSVTVPPAPTEPAADPEKGAILTQEMIREMEIRNTRNALEKTDWKVYGPHGAAVLLGIKPSTLTTRMKSWGIKRDS